MANTTVARTLARSIPRVSSSCAPVRSATKTSFPGARQFQQHARRQYSSETSNTRNKNTLYLGGAAVAAVAFAGAYYYARSTNKVPEVHLKQGSADQTPGIFNPTADDYQKVYNAVAKQLWDQDEYDDGSYGPVVLRLAFHASGTYDAATNTGGSNGATMRFAPERDQGANSGLGNARNFLEPIKEQFPWISYSDLWTLAGVCAVQEMQGPAIPWRPGRQDRDVAHCSPDGRLPDGSKDQHHIRAIFGRMGFDDQETVALLGAHALGRCHPDRSGYSGPWTFSPTVLTNDFYRLLAHEAWSWKAWDGPRQYEDETRSLMMLPTDMALVQDPGFKPFVLRYADDADAFFKDFSRAVCKMFELGVPFREGEERLVFRTFEEQEQE